MENYGVNQLREMFLRFFESKEHLRMNSFSLIPHNDNSLLIINSGMAPLKPYFTGAEIPPRRRVTTCQKCVRTGDIENVGKTARHGTFFEMLGNFSFGDYFKNEAIPWAWEFLTEVVGLDKDRLYPSVYVDDDEAFAIWRDKMGIAPERIFKFGKEDNFWEHGSGPCGPCSEIYYDRGEKYGCGKPDCTVGCECDRFMEVWNLVFTQFDNDGEGHYSRLEQTNIDTGMGLERLAVVVQDVDSIFDVDTLRALRDEICRLAGVTYGADHETDVSIRVITDHIRSATFMISDGITPENEGRGYVLRRLIRRAARHGRKLGIDHAFLSDLAVAVMEGSKDGYPELADRREFICKVLENEEKAFARTIDQGLTILSGMEEQMKQEGRTLLTGEESFRLYDTFGFPLDLTRDILEEKGYSVDEEGFAACMKAQQERARDARATSNYMGADETVFDTIDPTLETVFCGYDWLTCESPVRVLTKRTADGTEVLTDALTEGDEGTVIVERSPFYGTMGGQTGDRGEIRFPQGVFRVTDTVHLRGNKLGHIGTMISGAARNGENTILLVDPESREDTCRNHSATHLLHKALKTVLGEHVEQKGSLVSPERLRFDFSHFQPMTTEEIKEVERLVNEEIAQHLPVNTQVMGLDEAGKSGATALFDEKYGEEVRVVSMGDFSKELCGGTHVRDTGEIAFFRILSENGISAGVRRIEALTGRNVLRHLEEEETILQKAAAVVNTAPADLPEALEKLQAQLKKLQKENEQLKRKQATDQVGNVDDAIREIGGVKLLATSIPGVEPGALREVGDQLRDRIGEGVIALVSEHDGKVGILVMATDEAQKAGAHAGNLVKEAAAFVGGRGGGRPNMAQAGGKDPSGIPQMLEAFPQLLQAQLS